MPFEPTIVIIPLVSALVGWATNVLAVKMMFWPVDFLGIPPWLGWQGIIPANAARMGKYAARTISSKLLRLRELFDGFDAGAFVREQLAGPVERIGERVLAELSAHADALGPTQTAALTPLVRAELERVATRILTEVGEAIEEIVDIEAIVADAGERDRALIGELFLRIGRPEFRFIKRSGAYFGLLFGILPMVIWELSPSWWLLPVAGFLVGYATNWLALKLIFEPVNPLRLGPVVIQGLFHKRQRQVAEAFARLVADEVLHIDNMVRGMTSGAAGERLFGIIDGAIAELIARYRQNPLTQGLLTAAQWDELETRLPTMVRAELAAPGGLMYTFTQHTIDVYGELHGRMIDLDAASFEGILRPVFQQDEWKLIVVGAVLGLGAGVIQTLLLL
ncbi:DUF445 domain-containing protein [Haliangium sp.]|uniref:DUF445 domain-containing protein n=1 Tax=Haliangium sp. TaxID=2663208 RepID=UPI003D1261EC